MISFDQVALCTGSFGPLDARIDSQSDFRKTITINYVHMYLGDSLSKVQVIFCGVKSAEQTVSDRSIE